MNSKGNVAEYHLYNATGQMIQRMESAAVVYKLFTENLEPGFYVLRILSKDRETEFRLIRAGE